MITKQFISTCTDEQINKGVAWLEAKKLGLENPCEFVSYDNDLIFKDGEYSFSPCANPNDALPIVFANGIGINVFSRSPINLNIIDMWCGLVESYDKNGKYMFIRSKHTNPLRAAMEVYILMSTEK